MHAREARVFDSFRLAPAGRGLGGKLILRACRKVFALGIGDVAVMAPQQLQGLFQVDAWQFLCSC